MKGLLSDFLGKKEVEFTKACMNELEKDKNWESFLNQKAIKNVKNVKPDYKMSENDLVSLKSAMFEIRIAYLIHQSGLKAEYEFNPDKKNKKSIDFKVYGKKINSTNLLIELSSLRESYVQKNNTWVVNEKNKPVTFGAALDENDEISEYFKTQKILVEKSGKFPDKIIANQFNIILLDMRSSILGCCDKYDFHHILYGGKNLDPYVQHHMKNDKLFPGIFCNTHPGCNDNELIHLRESIHYFGFVVEEDFTQVELSTKIIWFKNPSLVIDGAVNLELKEILNGKDLS